jgi:hypothetical protein
MEVAHGRADMTMAEQALDGVDIDTGLQQVGGEAMAQGVDAATAFDPGRRTGGLVAALNR